MKIRVAMLIWRDGFGGLERSLRDLAAALDRDQFEIRFYFLSGPLGPLAEELTSLGYRVEGLHWSNGFSLAGRWRLLLALWRFRPMVIHDHTVTLLVRPLAKVVCRCPIVHSEHGPAMRDMGKPRGWRYRMTCLDLRCCDRILANSEASRRAVTGAYGYPESRVQTLYLGIDLQRFLPNSCNSAKGYQRRIGYVGRILNRHKGTDHLPHVARLLADMGRWDIEFVVVGDGPDRTNIELLCIQMGVSDLFSFLGYRADVGPILETLDVLLVPSRFEAFGLSGLEALAMGVPVVAFDVGGLSEALGRCETAYLVPPNDAEAMARATACILDLPCAHSKSSRAYVEAHFSSQRMASDMERVYKHYASKGLLRCPTHR